jgi:GTPase SAR1 family protein
MLWDTAGQEEFDAITKAYYRGAQACVLAFSTTDRDSFEAAHSWKMKVGLQTASSSTTLPSRCSSTDNASRCATSEKQFTMTRQGQTSQRCLT